MTAALIVPLTVWLLGGSPSLPPTLQEPARCRIVRVASDGTRTEEPRMPENSDLDAQADARGSRATASSRSTGSSRSSASVSASSRSGGGRSVASSSDGYRTITTTHDEAGCTTVIDERPAARRER